MIKTIQLTYSDTIIEVIGYYEKGSPEVNSIPATNDSFEINEINHISGSLLGLITDFDIMTIINSKLSLWEYIENKVLETIKNEEE